jgi:hypothetical protein
MLGANLMMISFTTSKTTYNHIKRIYIEKKKAKVSKKLVKRQKNNQKIKAFVQNEKLSIKQKQFNEEKKPLEVILEQNESEESS